MTAIARDVEGFVSGHLLEFVGDGLMAAGAFNVMSRDVPVVKPFGFCVAVEVLGFVVAIQAPVLRRVALSLDHIEVAALTRDLTRPNEILVIVGNISHLDDSIGSCVTGATTSQGLKFSWSSSPFEMTQKTGCIRNDHMVAHHDLAVTGGAAQVFSSPALG
jgi:hypothetical protein